MSIIINGMEMPASCGVCPLMRTVEYEEICPLLGEYACQYDRNDDCPLVPVPPHGRLIDADALFEEMERKGWFDNADRDEAEDLVLDAPTVIEAEEGE